MNSCTPHVDVTIRQWDKFFQESRRYFGLDLMAIIFSLPWALFIWSYVHSYSNVRPTFFHGIADISDRTLLFLVAVILYSWSISNLWSRIAIALISVCIFSLVGCVWAIWGPRDGLGVWLDSLRLSISRMLRASCVSIARLRHDITSVFCNRPIPTHVGSEHELADQRDGVISGV